MRPRNPSVGDASLLREATCLWWRKHKGAAPATVHIKTISGLACSRPPSRAADPSHRRLQAEPTPLQLVPLMQHSASKVAGWLKCNMQVCRVRWRHPTANGAGSPFVLFIHMSFGCFDLFEGSQLPCFESRIKHIGKWQAAYSIMHGRATCCEQYVRTT